eukprot:PhF_6_TR33679/c0_g1_i1/m.49335
MEMLVEWRWETVFTKRREGVKLGRPDVGRTRIAMERILHGAYAKSTRKMRIFIMNRYEEFLKETQMEHGEDGAMIFLTWMGSRTKASTCLTYATTLISLHPELKGQKMRQYMKGLIRMGALRPKFQANPITQQEIYKILEDMPIRLMVPTFLAWKTTSRWSDITQLRKENVHWISDEEMIIQFTDTKGAAHRPFREDHLVHLTHAESMSEIRKSMENLGPRDRITQVTSAEINSYFKARGLPYTTHSIKRGAMTVLMAAVKTNLIPLEMIPRMGKHARRNPTLPDTTIRYLADKVDLAVSLGTGLATLLL